MQRGVAYGVMAGALWGIVFSGPARAAGFSPLLLSARAATRCTAWSRSQRRCPQARSLLKRLTREDLVALVKLALGGNLLYYLLLTAAVAPRRHRAGVADRRRIAGDGHADGPSATAARCRSARLALAACES